MYGWLLMNMNMYPLMTDVCFTVFFLCYCAPFGKLQAKAIPSSQILCAIAIACKTLARVSSKARDEYQRLRVQGQPSILSIPKGKEQEPISHRILNTSFKIQGRTERKRETDQREGVNSAHRATNVNSNYQKQAKEGTSKLSKCAYLGGPHSGIMGFQTSTIFSSN